MRPALVLKGFFVSWGEDGKGDRGRVSNREPVSQSEARWHFLVKQSDAEQGLPHAPDE